MMEASMVRSLTKGKYYSIGAWTIKPGRENEFVSTWNDFAQWTTELTAGESMGTLVQDVEEPRLFYCFWPFETEERIKKWRSEPKFRELMMRMRAFCESWHPSIARVVGTVGGEAPP
jgi:heme-degrading monooxygenase HmoA